MLNRVDLAIIILHNFNSKKFAHVDCLKTSIWPFKTNPTTWHMNIASTNSKINLVS